MDWAANTPTWVAYGVVGAVIGGALGLLGALLARSGMTWGRYLPVLTIAFLQPVGDRIRPFIEQATWTDQQTENALQSEMPNLLPYLKEAFPEDHAHIISSATRLVKTSTSSTPVRGQMAEVVAEVRRKYAPFIKFADDASLISMLSHSIDFHEEVLAREGAGVCGEVAISGPMALNPLLAAKYTAMLDIQSAALFRAVRSGIDSPIAREEASGADWEAVGKVMLDLGADKSTFASIEAMNPADPELCPALILLLKAMASPQAPGTVRAQYLTEASAS